MSALPHHPLADIFPTIDGEEFAALAADIRAHGLRQRIVLFDGQILDGRNRYRACIEAGVEPRFEQYNGADPLSYVISLNLKRRHLDESQRAMVAAKIATLPKGANQHASIEAPSQNAAADMLNVSRSGVQRARTVIAEGIPELADKVARGEVSVSAAADVARLPEIEQREIVSNGMAYRQGGDGNNEWYTPAKYIELARAVMGGIDLDPASNQIAQQTVQAAQFFTQDDDGLTKTWTGRVFCNPPYSGGLMLPFVEKLVCEVADGNVREAILLTHNHSETRWFQAALGAAARICFIAGKRIKFIAPDGKIASPVQGQCFHYWRCAMTGLFTTSIGSCALWEHQKHAIAILADAFSSGARRPLLQLPTGSGKTRIAAELIRNALAAAERVIFVVPRIVLIEQTVAAFEREGIPHIGVIQGQNFRTDGGAPVQIASQDTLVRRITPRADIVFIDEAHIKRAKIQKWMASPGWADIPFIGLTATPWARGLGKIYDRLLRPISMAELIERGILSKFRIFAPPPPNLTSVRTANDGDFHEGDLSSACSKAELVADIIKTWFEKGENRPTLCYGVDRKHAQHLQERFVEAGVAAEYIDCETPMYVREEIFERFAESKTKIICNVATCDTGLDLDIRCIIDARPTKSRIRFVQTIGRGLRMAEGKDHLIILDHAGDHQRLGRVIDIDFPRLDDGATNIIREKAKAEYAPNIKLCPECRCVLPPRARECPACGEPIYASTKIVEKDGELVEFGRNVPTSEGFRGPPIHEQATFFAMLQGYRSRLKPHYKPTWAACQFREKFGFWPNDWRVRNVEPLAPDIKVFNWIKSRQIAFAKAKERARG